MTNVLWGWMKDAKAGPLIKSSTLPAFSSTFPSLIFIIHYLIFFVIKVERSKLLNEFVRTIFEVSSRELFDCLRVQLGGWKSFERSYVTSLKIEICVSMAQSVFSRNICNCLNENITSINSATGKHDGHKVWEVMKQFMAVRSSFKARNKEKLSANVEGNE